MSKEKISRNQVLSETLKNLVLAADKMDKLGLKKFGSIIDEVIESVKHPTKK